MVMYQQVHDFVLFIWPYLATFIAGCSLFSATIKTWVGALADDSCLAKVILYEFLYLVDFFAVNSKTVKTMKAELSSKMGEK